MDYLPSWAGIRRTVLKRKQSKEFACAETSSSKMCSWATEQEILTWSEHKHLFSHFIFNMLTFCLLFPVPVCHWGKTPAGEGLCLIVVDQNPDYWPIRTLNRASKDQIQSDGVENGSRQISVGWKTLWVGKDFCQRTAKWMASVVSKALPLFPWIKVSQDSVCLK